MQNKKNFVLGGAQFSKQYGLNRKSIHNKKSEIIDFIKYAYRTGFREFDSAISYNVPKSIYANLQKTGFKISSKLPNIKKFNKIDFEERVFLLTKKYLSTKKIKNIHVFYLHDTSIIKNKKKLKMIFNSLKKLKEKKIINKIGISVYSPQDMRNVIEYLKPNFPDVIQFPYNFLDRRFEKNQILNIFKKFNIESYARSVYLQGLLLLDKKNRPLYFTKFNKILSSWDIYCENLHNKKLQTCINFVTKNKNIKKIVIGFDNLKNIKEFNKYLIKKNVNKYEFNKFRKISSNLIDPRKWKIS